MLIDWRFPHSPNARLKEHIPLTLAVLLPAARKRGDDTVPPDRGSGAATWLRPCARPGHGRSRGSSPFPRPGGSRFVLRCVHAPYRHPCMEARESWAALAVSEWGPGLPVAKETRGPRMPVPWFVSSLLSAGAGCVRCPLLIIFLSKSYFSVCSRSSITCKRSP